ncbi:MAG: TolC family protein [Gemmatimonadota bacterium]|nr:TolC family protein [Gemmatimonadota bacterium]
MARPAGAQVVRDTVSEATSASHRDASFGRAESATSFVASGDPVLDELIAEALERSPQVRATSDRITASRARIRPAGTRSDPVLMAGLIQIPVRKPSLTDDNFTMLMAGITQTIPYPGKLRLRTRVAELDADAAVTAGDQARLQVVRAVKDAYYELAFADQALAIAERNQTVLGEIVRVTTALYGTGTGGQHDVLKARIETAKLAERASTLVEARRAALAELNAVRDRASDAPVERAGIPPRIADAAIAADASAVHYMTTSLGSRVARSPFPPLAMLQQEAIRNSPMLREHEARIAAQAASVELARTDYQPDFDVNLQYNHRLAYPDLFTAQVSFPLRLQKSSKQDQAVAENVAELSALEAEHAADINMVRGRVATLLSDLERNRTQLALYVGAILPQSRAGVTSALASLQSGRASLLSVLDLQNTVFTYETAYYRALSDFAKELAELEQVTGTQVLP